MRLEQAIARTTLDRITRQTGYDAIIVGAGASGGLAATLLTEAGLNTLVLDAGLQAPFFHRPIDRTLSWMLPTFSKPELYRFLPWRVINKTQQAFRMAGRLRRPIQSKCYAWPTAPDAFVDDLDNPYNHPTDKPYNWIRVRKLGGRMIVPAHGKQYYRHSQIDFTPSDNLGPNWPVSATDLDPWYVEVERRLSLNGRYEHSPWIPDSVITNELEPNDTQATLIEKIGQRWKDADIILGRYALPLNSLDTAAQTGRLDCRQGAIGCQVLFNAQGRANGMRFYDQKSKMFQDAQAPLVFLCASALESTRILMLSRSKPHVKGVGISSDALGRYIMDHVSLKIEGVSRSKGLGRSKMGVEDCIFLPRFDMRDGNSSSAGRGYGVRVYMFPGADNTSHFTAVSDAEMLPHAENRVELSTMKDKWGIPALKISCEHHSIESQVAQEQLAALSELADLFDVTIHNKESVTPSIPGSSIHEVGGARMGTSPEESVLDLNNQVWDSPGLYVTDGAAFPSIGIQNPTLTIMALTARACDHAIQSKRGY